MSPPVFYPQKPPPATRSLSGSSNQDIGKPVMSQRTTEDAFFRMMQTLPKLPTKNDVANLYVDKRDSTLPLPIAGQTAGQIALTPGEVRYKPDGGVNAQEFINAIYQAYKSGNAQSMKDLAQQYKRLCQQAEKMLKGLTWVNNDRNPERNRYADIKCFDHTRVKIPRTSRNEEGYINANYVDGYRRKRKFICTQGPTEDTCIDFWTMIWMNKCTIIVMLTRIIEEGREKCFDYWPTTQSKTKTAGFFKIESMGCRKNENETVSKTILRINHTDTGEVRSVAHLLFLDWPDFGVPNNSVSFWRLCKTMNMEHYYMQSSNGMKPTEPTPIVVHCSAGVGRTGTMCALDICSNQLLDQKLVNIPGVVCKLRQQRHHAVQRPEQYGFLNFCLIELIMRKGLLTRPPELDPILNTECYRGMGPFFPATRKSIISVGSPSKIKSSAKSAQKSRVSSNEETEKSEKSFTSKGGRSKKTKTVKSKTRSVWKTMKTKKCKPEKPGPRGSDEGSAKQAFPELQKFQDIKDKVLAAQENKKGQSKMELEEE